MTLSAVVADSAMKILVAGRVQGLGVRPAIVRLANKLNLSGYVKNTSDGVAIHVEGDSASVSQFSESLLEHMPRGSKSMILRTTASNCEHIDSFEIRTEEPSRSVSGVSVDVPTDLAMCAECRRELNDRFDRRCGYEFSSCTECGPRYSIIRAMPYERHETSMATFRMCAHCAREYAECSDRRFHAQTIACADCGPRVWFESSECTKHSFGAEAVTMAAEIIQSGGILAFKGLGGYQLICDARNAATIRRLRQWKDRDAKPLAVMISEIAGSNHTGVDAPATNAGRHALALLNGPVLKNVLTEIELLTLTSSANPIVIAQSSLFLDCDEVSPHLATTGLFLPTTPLHVMLIDAARTPLVVTSGNRDSEPLAFDQQHAFAALHDIADAWLHHDRKILRPVDDSVVRIIAGRPVTIRAARGIAPLPLAIETSENILAVGGHQKVAIALSNGHQAVLGPHFGDMTSIAARQRFIEQTQALQELYGSNVRVIAHDLHPDYFTTQWAAEQGCRTMAIQHHHAHVVASMVEHGLLNQEVLGLAFDGTGLGSDGTIWGGEFLLASSTEYRRVGHLMPFALPGGETAIREPWRIAVSLLAEAMPELSDREIVNLINNVHKSPETCSKTHHERTRESSAEGTGQRDASPIVTIEQVARTRQVAATKQAPMTSSMGRLFDGVASIVLGVSHCSFEGELAMRLEDACERNRACGDVESSGNSDGLLPCIHVDNGIQIDWRPLFRHLVDGRRAGNARSEQAIRFHQSLAVMAGRMADQFPDYPVVLSGGCFQNKVLTELIVNELGKRSRVIAAPGKIPPNDGGLAAGQLAIAAARLKAEQWKGT